ncbi:predicted protein [Sparassis crispa]|uniref:Major facilitator superfamily (MFS) profile domain-containing protein n=1 Tax=Sparassis crispa TaxID=139825 RepID=A0A401GFU3_9APHY|nr:predicted protein [Sparassis crispa]GBE80995.1 predicted protein [Sparassis crispa]
MIGLFVPVFFETIDYTVVSTAQVHIASAFNRLDLESYIGTAFLLTSTVFLPVFASIADVWDRHWTLQLSLVFFIVGSAVSTGSENMATMLAGRGIAGIGAAGLQAVVRIIMADSRSLNDNNWQQTLLFFLYTVGFCVGPVIGGALLSVSFRWIFAINLPTSFVGIVLAFLFLRTRTKGRGFTDSPSVEKESTLERLARVDWFGASLFMAGGILILLALNWGSVFGWNSGRVIACFVVGGIVYIVFIGLELFLGRTASHAASSIRRVLPMDPMIPMDIFSSYDVCIDLFTMFVSGLVMLVAFYFISIYMIVVTGLSSTKAGAQLIYFAPGMGVGSLLQIQMVKYLRQPKYPIILGTTITPIALGLISMAMQNIKRPQINGFLAMAGSTAVHIRFLQSNDRVAIVAALTLFFRSLGGTVGLAQCGAVLNSKIQSHMASLTSSGLLTPAQASELSQSAGSLTSLQSIDALPLEVQALVREAFRSGSRWSFISLIPWAGLACICTFFLSRIKDTNVPQPPSPKEVPLEAVSESMPPGDATADKDLITVELDSKVV